MFRYLLNYNKYGDIMKKVITIIITIVVILIILGISLYLLQTSKYEVVSNLSSPSGPNNKGYNVDNNVH